MALLCISLMTNEVEHLLGVHFATFTSLIKCVLMCVIGRTISSPKYYATIPRTSRKCYFAQQNYFADVIKGMDFEKVRVSGIIWVDLI